MTISTPLVRSERTSVREVLELELLDNRYPALHGLRVIGIVLVLQYHVTQSLVLVSKLPMNRGWAMLSMAIFFGMDLFFVLSGFLIGSILLRSLDSVAPGHLRRFYLRRAFRTFPSYYVVLTFLALTTALTATQRHNLPFDYAYLTNYKAVGISPAVDPFATVAAGVGAEAAHPQESVMPWGWSLGVEEHFYLLVPFLFAALRKLRTDRARLAVLVTLWLSAFVIRLVLYLHYPADLASAYVRTHTRSDTLAAGVIIAYVHHRWGDRLTRWLDSPAARAAIGVPTLGCLWILLNPGIFGDGALASVFLWGTISSLMYFGFVLFLLNGGNGWIRRALSAPLFRRIATLGYGVYLVHIPICYVFINPGASALVDRWGWSMTAVWPLSLAALIGASLVMAYVMHIVIEKPSLRLRDRVAG
jgi:peptidoglycan/LPS O-acetylase OafA/YrhL